MTRPVIVVAIVLGAGAVACSKPKPEPAPAKPQVTACARLADHLVSLMSGATKHPPEATDPLRRVVEQRCTDDRWSDATTKCLLELATLADGQKCQATMTPAQVEAFQRETESATVELRGQLTEQPLPTRTTPDAGIDQ
jgi:hypothetical protein